MTISDFLNNATLQDKLDAVNEILRNLRMSDTYLIDEENKDTFIDKVLYDRDADEVLYTSNNLHYDYYERQSELAEAL